jgi:hypothetical protein
VKVRAHRGDPYNVKVRAHRGDPYNEAADRVPYTTTHDEDIPLLWKAPSGHIIYQFTPDFSESEDTLYTATINDTVKKFIKNQTALSAIAVHRMPFMCRRLFQKHNFK